MTEERHPDIQIAEALVALFEEVKMIRLALERLAQAADGEDRHGWKT